MSIQDIAEKMRARVESSGFDRSVKFDTGADGVIVIDGTDDLDDRRPGRLHDHAVARRP